MPNQPELHLIIIWHNALYAYDKIIRDIRDKFVIVDVMDIEWSDTNFSSNMTRFYGQKLPRGSHKETHCGRGPFRLVIVKDASPVYGMRETTAGKDKVNIRMFDAKTLYRKWTGGGHRIHCTNSVSETDHDLTLLLGCNVFDYQVRNCNEWNGEITTLKKDLEGAGGWKNLNRFFYVLNGINNYIVLRNFECLPDDYTLTDHGDIDLLTDNLTDLIYISNGEKVFKNTYRVHYMVKIDGKDIPFDFRYVGDNYYDIKWEKQLLTNRIFSEKKCIYNPDIKNYFYSLLYHALVHKQDIAGDYKKRLTNYGTKIGLKLKDRWFKDKKQLKKLLDRYLTDNGFEYTDPVDLSVFFNTMLTGQKYLSPERIVHSFIVHKSFNEKQLNSFAVSVKNTFPSIYEHLSYKRSLIIDILDLSENKSIFEFNCGMGSITSYLGNNFKDVTALEQNPVRAEISALRCKNQNNVHIYNLPYTNLTINKQFDIVTVIGAFESANENKIIETAVSVVKENGIIILGYDIQDEKFGDSIPVLSSDHEKLQTINKTGILSPNFSQKLTKLGFKYQLTLYPFPNYKFPNVFLTEEILNSIEEPQRFASEAKQSSMVSTEIASSLGSSQNGSISLGKAIGNWIGSDFLKSNYSDDISKYSKYCMQGCLRTATSSRIIVAAKRQEDLPVVPWLLKSYSGEARFPSMRTRTILTQNGDGMMVVKSGANHRSGIFKFHPVSIDPFYEGEILSQIISKALINKNYIRVKSLLKEYQDFLIKTFRICGKQPIYNIAGDNIFISGDAVDAIPRNIIVTDGEFNLFDQEWSFDVPVPLSFVMYRAVMDLLLAGGSKNLCDLYCKGMTGNKKGILTRLVKQISGNSYIKDKDIEMFEILETRFQEFASDGVSSNENITFIEKCLLTNKRYLDNEAIPLVSIIILTYNALKYTKKCIKSIQEHTTYPYEIILVDNSSTDGTIDFLHKLVRQNDHYKLIKNAENRGFAGGNNQGVTAANGKYVMLLNNDVLVSDGWLESLVNSIEKDEKIGMVGPITNSISGRQMVTNVPYKDDNGFYKFAQNVRELNKNKLTPRRRLAGFAVLLKKSVYEEVDGLDETFGVGNFEDDDLCLKIRQKGYALIVDESVFIHHFGSQTFKANNIAILDNLKERMPIFTEKWKNVDYEELLEMRSPLSETHPKLLEQASEYFITGEVVRAISSYENVLMEDPLSQDAIFGLALCFHQQNDRETALSYLQRLLKINPDHAMAYNESGLISVEVGDMEG
ncbi:MAG: glycosyltransferase, partial [Candidatus Hatepunaea meridiana]|nr:glycosyltransferase [Candidatus Hatepunaea meridiana]